MPGFRVGIEVELLLTLRREPSKEIEELKVLANAFAKRYNKEAGENRMSIRNLPTRTENGVWPSLDALSVRIPYADR
jgi:hypothetical protein